MASHPFREAVERGDHDGMVAALAPDVLLHSPVAFRPFAGREAVVELFNALMDNFEDFRYTDELVDGNTTMLIFRARIGDKSVQGLDLLRVNDAGLIEEFTVMLRPLSAIMALGERIAPRVEGLAKGEASSPA
jgi:SnoaL-like domain